MGADVKILCIDPPLIVEDDRQSLRITGRVDDPVAVQVSVLLVDGRPPACKDGRVGTAMVDGFC